MLFASLAHVVWIRVDCKGSFKISGQLRDFVMRQVADGNYRFVVDLDRCSGMDSTFMGTLLGVSRDVTAASEDGLLDIVNANGRNLQLLKNLGLTNVLSVDEHAERWHDERKHIGQGLSPCQEVSLDKKATADIMLVAHQALAEAQPENKARFKDVIHFLEEDLKANSSASC